MTSFIIVSSKRTLWFGEPHKILISSFAMATMEPISKVYQLGKILCPSQIPDRCTWRCTAWPGQFLDSGAHFSPQGIGIWKDLPSIYLVSCTFSEVSQVTAEIKGLNLNRRLCAWLSKPSLAKDKVLARDPSPCQRTPTWELET